MSKEQESSINIPFMVIGILIVIYFIFLFDYKKDTFTWLHSIIGIVGVVLIIMSTEKNSNSKN